MTAASWMPQDWDSFGVETLQAAGLVQGFGNPFPAGDWALAPAAR
jgi:hypothetical protein